MANIQFIKQNGGIGRQAASEDPISGLLIGIKMRNMNLPNFDRLNYLKIAALTYYEQLAALGITKTTADGSTLTAAQLAMNLIDYHVSEFFHYSPTGTLYLAIKEVPEDAYLIGDDLATLQHYAGGKMRQVGVICPDYGGSFTKTLDDKLAQLEAEGMPLQVLLGTFLIDFQENAFADNSGNPYMNERVSLVVGQDLDPALVASLNDADYTYSALPAVGTALGCVSAAAVNESVAWVQKFPLDSVKLPGSIDGLLLAEDEIFDTQFCNLPCLSFVKYAGSQHTYWNDSRTLADATSDYAYIENVRTMDKATRGIRANLLPYLNSPLYVDPETGKLDVSTVAHLETVAGKALENMEKAGELSGYKVEIDPEQNVLSTSEVTIVIKQVPVGVMRQVKVKIGFTTKLS